MVINCFLRKLWEYQATPEHRNPGPVLEFTLMAWKFEYEGKYSRAERRDL